MTNQPTAKDGDMIAQANKVMAKERELKKTLEAPQDALVDDIIGDFVPDPLSAKHVVAGIVPAEDVDDLIEAEIHRKWSEPHDDHPAGLASLVSAPVTIFERTDEVTASVTLPSILKTGKLHTTSAVLHNGKRVEAGTEIEVKDGDTLQFIDLKPDQEAVSAWDPRTWIAPEKAINFTETDFERPMRDANPDWAAPQTLKRIDKIGRY